MKLLPWAIAASSALVYAIALLPAGGRAGPYIALHLALAAMQLALFVLLARAPDDGREALRTRIRNTLYAAVAARVLLILCAPFTTTDVSRYLWDGAVVLEGRDPFALAPNAPALAALRSRWPLPLDHHDVVGCYPPLAEALFAFCALFGPSAAQWAWKALVALVTAASARSLARACTSNAQLAAATLWLLHPLALFEGGVGAHLDAITGAMVLWAILAAERDQWRRAALWLGAATAIKLTPVLVCVALWPRARPRWSWPFLCAAIPAVTIGVPWALGAAFPGSLPLVAQHWNFGSPLWTALYARFSTSDALIRPALTALGLALVLAQWLRPKASHGTVARDALVGYAITNPTLYPWYLLPSLACGARAPSAFLWALCAVTPLTYEVIDRYGATGVWSPARWPLWVTAVAPPLVALGAWLWLRRERARSQP